MILPAAGVLFALTTAFLWGGADFFGGLASRRSSHVEVLAVSRVSLILVLATLVVVTGESLPPMQSVLWAAAAGLSGASGLAALYKGLAVGRSSLVIPTAGVVGAALPVILGAVFDGVLPLVQQAGLIVALVGIWFVSEGHADDSRSETSTGLSLGLMAGLGFGGAYLLLGQVQEGYVYTPVAIAGAAGILIAVAALVTSRTPLPNPMRNPSALMAGTMDSLGTVCYMFAINLIRLDVAVVLGSLYPAIAVLLFWGVLKERVIGRQWVGLALCVVAIALIVV